MMICLPHSVPRAANGPDTRMSGVSVKSNPPLYCKAQDLMLLSQLTENIVLLFIDFPD